VTTYTWTGGNGDWSTNTDWNPSGVPGSADDAALPENGNYTVTISQAESVDNLTIALGATLEIENSSQLTVDGNSINNSGTFAIAASTTYTVLTIDSNGTTLQDGGTVQLSDSIYNLVDGSGKLTNVDNTITGAGTLGYGGGLTLDNQLSGTIDATGTNALIINAGTLHQ